MATLIGPVSMARQAPGLRATGAVNKPSTVVEFATPLIAGGVALTSTPLAAVSGVRRVPPVEGTVSPSGSAETVERASVAHIGGPTV